MNKSYKHIPKDKRKKILLVTDDIRVHSGVATVAREIVIKTCHHYNWVQIAGALKNIYAIASGIVFGKKYGENAVASIISRSFAEIKIVAQSMNAKKVHLLVSQVWEIYF